MEYIVAYLWLLLETDVQVSLGNSEVTWSHDKVLAIRRFIWWNITEGEIFQQWIEFIHWVGMFQLDEIVLMPTHWNISVDYFLFLK